MRRLAGLQAQDSTGPYLSLWSRLEGFDRAELTAAVEERRVLVATLMRGTMHMVAAEDHAWLKPTLAPLAENARQRPGVRDLDHEALLAEARRRLPAKIPELRKLAPAGLNPGYLADFFQSSLPLVRVPPAGTWQVGGSPVQELVEVGEPDVGRLVLAYLRAFGPATVRDAQAWSGLTKLKPVFDRLDLDELEGPDGVLYYDVPGAPRPPGDPPAPVRLLPRFDNLLLAHADRSRFGAVVIGGPNVLVDGVVEPNPSGRAVAAERRALERWLA